MSSIAKCPELMLNNEYLVAAPRLETICVACEDGAGVFELFQIKKKKDVLKYVHLYEQDRTIPDHWKVVLRGPALFSQKLVSTLNARAVVRFLRELLTFVQFTQSRIRSSDDPAIRRELEAVENSTHSWYKLRQRADAASARRAAYPRRRHPWYVYKVFSAVLKIPCIRSVTFFLDEDIGLVHIACNELIFSAAGSNDTTSKTAKYSVKLAIHPDYTCWDEDDNFYQFPGWPDWADAATWFENLPTQSDLLVMSVRDGDEYSSLMKRSERHSNYQMVMLVHEGKTPRCQLHNSYIWYWHSGNIFLGMKKGLDQSSSSRGRRLAADFDMESVAANY